MTNAELTLRNLRVFKLITDYQIKWLSTNFEIPNLTYQIILNEFPHIPLMDATKLINEWIEYEISLNIDIFNKSKFNEDSNVETLMKMRRLSQQLDAQIRSVLSVIEKESPKKPNDEVPFTVERGDDGITLTFLNKSWFRKDNVITLSIEHAMKLQEELQNKLIGIKK